jgi:hypothetical protein
MRDLASHRVRDHGSALGVDRQLEIRGIPRDQLRRASGSDETYGADESARKDDESNAQGDPFADYRPHARHIGK